MYLRLEELGLLHICLGLLFLGTIEGILHRKHGHNRQDLLGTPKINAVVSRRVTYRKILVSMWNCIGV